MSGRPLRRRGARPLGSPLHDPHVGPDRPTGRDNAALVVALVAGMLLLLLVTWAIAAELTLAAPF